MTVEVKWNIWLHQKIIGLAGIGDVQTKLRTTGDLTSGGTGGSTITVNHDTIGTFGTVGTNQIGVKYKTFFI